MLTDSLCFLLISPSLAGEQSDREERTGPVPSPKFSKSMNGIGESTDGILLRVNEEVECGSGKHYLYVSMTSNVDMQ